MQIPPVLAAVLGKIVALQPSVLHDIRSVILDSLLYLSTANIASHWAS